MLSIGAIDSPLSSVLRFDKLISALKVHGYRYGDISIQEDQLSRSTNEIGKESRDILRALADKAS